LIGRDALVVMVKQIARLSAKYPQAYDWTIGQVRFYSLLEDENGRMEKLTQAEAVRAGGATVEDWKRWVKQTV
jgi:hypothetical protein